MAQSPGMTKNSKAFAKKEAYLKKAAKRSQSKTRALTSIVALPSSSLGKERLTRQIVETVSSVFGGDVMAVVEANHICMISRGIEKVGSSTATIATLGRFSTDPSAKELFLQTVSDSTACGG
ncbi:hypothetical protein IFM89_034889 [Coptis chinensis]|uniref:GTP cyclohydrolase 1 n=1 Tax=Coptis chinensis TaxID=261450 RepID=A0A835I6N2_9MAGN|nr:hypothetical protein IFM89_034889 [Coptis chinensis]